jgi:hypothetical protein
VFFFLANYSQISTLEKWQLVVQRKKRGSNDESSPESIWRWMGWATKLSDDGTNWPVQALNILGCRQVAMKLAVDLA